MTRINVTLCVPPRVRFFKSNEDKCNVVCPTQDKVLLFEHYMLWISDRGTVITVIK